jgi:hypothetical protein
MKITLPTIFTLLRIALIPVLMLVLYLPVQWNNEVAVAVFILAGFTDWLDGWLARKTKQTSRFGAFLDPVADKLMVRQDQNHHANDRHRISALCRSVAGPAGVSYRPGVTGDRSNADLVVNVSLSTGSLA